MEEISKVLKSNPGLLNLFKVAITCNKAQIVRLLNFLMIPGALTIVFLKGGER